MLRVANEYVCRAFFFVACAAHEITVATASKILASYHRVRLFEVPGVTLALPLARDWQ